MLFIFININISKISPYDEIKLNFKELHFDTFQNPEIGDYSMPKTFVINLETSKDRLTDITEKAKNADVDFERWAATDGRIMDQDELKRLGLSTWSSTDINKNKKGALGCFLSHKNLWKHIQKQSYDNEKAFLILEDDVVFSDNIVEKIKNALKLVDQNNWDMLMLGYGSPNWYNKSDTLGKLEGFDGTYAYIINGSSLQKVIPYFELIGEPIDTAMSRFSKSGNIDIYAVIPPIITPGTHPSTIGN